MLNTLQVGGVFFKRVKSSRLYLCILMETATPPVKTAVMSSVALAELSNVVGNNLVDVIVVILACAWRLQSLHYNLSLWTFQKHLSKGGSKKLSIVGN